MNFERGRDPKRAMGIGRPPTIQEKLEKIFEEYLSKFSNTSKIDYNWKEDLCGEWCTYAEYYVIATVPCKLKKIRKKIKNMVEEPSSLPGPDYLFWDKVFDLIEEEGYRIQNFNVYLYGIPRKGVRVHLVIE